MPYPKISVIMPTFNRAKRLKEAIKSVLNQTLRDFELIIINDGSTDNTKEVISKFNDPRIVYLEKKNGGPSSARNEGLLKAKGRYISYLDDDDIYYPCHLGVLSRYLDRNPATGLIYGSIHFKIRQKIFKPYPFDYSPERLELDNFIPPNSLMHRKECLKKSGFFDERLSFAEDWDMWLRISDAHRIFHLEKFVACVNFHDGNITEIAGDRHKSKSYMHVIAKRTGLRGRRRIKHLPFGGYYMGLAYRLVYKFNAKEESCLKFMRRLVDIDNKNPEAGIALCACYLAYHEFDKAVKAGLRAKGNLPRTELVRDNFQRSCAFNVRRLLSHVFKRKNNFIRMQAELKEAGRFIAKDEKPDSAFINITVITSRFLNNSIEAASPL